MTLFKRIKQWAKSTSKFSRRVSNSKFNNGSSLAILLFAVIMLSFIIFMALFHGISCIPLLLQALLFGIACSLFVFLILFMLVSI